MYELSLDDLLQSNYLIGITMVSSNKATPPLARIASTTLPRHSSVASTALIVGSSIPRMTNHIWVCKVKNDHIMFIMLQFHLLMRPLLHKRSFQVSSHTLQPSVKLIRIRVFSWEFSLTTTAEEECNVRILFSFRNTKLL